MKHKISLFTLLLCTLHAISMDDPNLHVYEFSNDEQKLIEQDYVLSELCRVYDLPELQAKWTALGLPLLNHEQIHVLYRKTN